MRAKQIGISGVLIILSASEIATLHKGFSKNPFFLLEDKEGAPGFSVMVENDHDHLGRAKPGDKLPALRRFAHKVPQKTAAKNGAGKKTSPRKR